MDGSSEDARSTAAAASSLEGQALRETLGKVNELLIETSNPKIHDRCLAVVNSRTNLQASVGTRIFEINVKQIDGSTTPVTAPLLHVARYMHGSVLSLFLRHP